MSIFSSFSIAFRFPHTGKLDPDLWKQANLSGITPILKESGQSLKDKLVIEISFTVVLLESDWSALIWLYLGLKGTQVPAKGEALRV